MIPKKEELILFRLYAKLCNFKKKLVQLSHRGGKFVEKVIPNSSPAALFISDGNVSFISSRNVNR